MCRFTFYLGRPIRLGALIDEPKHSLINQSFEAQERDEPLNGDGFGLAWYNPVLSEEPALFKSISPAWSNHNLRELCRVIEAGCILAHVRAATQSLAVAESNCHPFKWGKYAFMHNGDLGGFKKLRRPLLNMLSDKSFNHIKGTTDSEHFFALLLDELAACEEMDKGTQMTTAMMNSIRKVLALVRKYAPGEEAYLNMVLSDGNMALAVRFASDDPEWADSLYLNVGRKYKCEDGLCYMVEPGEEDKAVIVSSEPLSKDGGWEKIPGNTMVLVQYGKILDRIDIDVML